MSAALLSAEERQQVLEKWNNSTRPTDHKGIPELFEAQVERSPNALAVLHHNEQLTYRQLNERANQLAHYLIAENIGPENVVGIALERSMEMIVAVVGVLKAGAAYLPLDLSYPPERLKFMIDDAEPSL